MKKYLVLGLLILSFVFAAPAVAKADLVSDLQAQISSLIQMVNLQQQLINLLQAEISRLTGTPAPVVSGTPVVSGVSGPATLTVGQQGTWTVQASNPSNGTLSYAVTWGDETVQTTLTTVPVFTQTAIFTHVYSAVGVYTARFVVRNSSGQSAQTSLSVSVGNVVPPSTAKPDLVVTDFVLYPPANTTHRTANGTMLICKGDKVTLTAIVKNQGNADVPAGTWLGLGYKFNGQSKNVYGATTAGLKVGQSANITASGDQLWTVEATGNYQIEAFIDDQNLIAESNENNNKLMKTAYIGTTDTGCPAAPSSIAPVQVSSVSVSRDRQDGVRISWPAATDALNYGVYRCPTASLSNCTDLKPGGIGQLVSYLDDTVTAGQDVYYAVDTSNTVGWGGLVLSTQAGRRTAYLPTLSALTAAYLQYDACSAGDEGRSWLDDPGQRRRLFECTRSANLTAGASFLTALYPQWDNCGSDMATSWYDEAGAGRRLNFCTRSAPAAVGGRYLAQAYLQYDGCGTDTPTGHWLESGANRMMYQCVRFATW